eukprot:TRINITY_DN393960_c0_g1_i1.p1 TRINITY_DN393960_c0_g1~~TRINITY_DN393960_c0_g1_i1.p1  ORF type:complete len:313 (+),score=3.05 TRINITY_DN393960_c0_g1_i1:101-940(+)
MFTWDWLEQFDCVTAYQEHLINTLSSKAAKEEVLKRYREHFTGKEILPQKIENNLSALQLHSEWQFQRIKVPYDTDDVLTWIATRTLKIFSYKGLLDMSSMANDLYGSLGNFGLYAAITKATVKKSKKTITITITEVGLYMRDTYDFIGNQYLGTWTWDGVFIDARGVGKNKLADGYNSIEEGVERQLDKYPFVKKMLNNLANNTPRDIRTAAFKTAAVETFEFIKKEYDLDFNQMEAIGNSDYQNYQKNTKKGGDLLLFSDVKMIPVNIKVILNEHDQ